MADCQLCNPEFTTPVYYHGERAVVSECDTCGRPVIALINHTSDPPKAVQAYCIGIVRGLFGETAAFLEASHGTPETHWNRHIKVPTE